MTLNVICRTKCKSPRSWSVRHLAADEAMTISVEKPNLRIQKAINHPLLFPQYFEDLIGDLVFILSLNYHFLFHQAAFLHFFHVYIYIHRLLCDPFKFYNCLLGSIPFVHKLWNVALTGILLCHILIMLHFLNLDVYNSLSWWLNFSAHKFHHRVKLWP